MAKLTVKMGWLFETGPLVVRNHEILQDEKISGLKLEKMFTDADPSKFGFEVMAADVYFSFLRSTGKRRAIFEVKLNDDLLGLTGRVEGQFEVKLRAGVAHYLSNQGDGLDLRIRSITWNGGSWQGFSAYPVGIDGTACHESFFQVLPKPLGFAVK